MCASTVGFPPVPEETLYAAALTEKDILKLRARQSSPMKVWMKAAEDELNRRAGTDPAQRITLGFAWCGGARIDPDDLMYAYDLPSDIVVFTADDKSPPAAEDVARWLEQKRKAIQEQKQ